MSAQLCTPESACAGQPDQIVTQLALSHLAAGRGKSVSMGARSILRASSLHSAVVAACDACSNAAAQIHHRDTARSHQTEAALCRRSQCWRSSLMQVQNKQNSGTGPFPCARCSAAARRGGPYSAVMGGKASSEGSQRAPANGTGQKQAPEFPNPLRISSRYCGKGLDERDRLRVDDTRHLHGVKGHRRQHPHPRSRCRARGARSWR